MQSLLLLCVNSTRRGLPNTGQFISLSGISDLRGTVVGIFTPKGTFQQRERHSKFLSYLTGARYVHPWCNVSGRILITGLTSAAPPRLDISSTFKVGQKISVSPYVDMLHFGVTIPATVPQRSEIPEGLMNYLV